MVNTLGRKGLVLFCLLAILQGCAIAREPSVQLGVPFRQQEGAFYCATAVVLMWRLYDGLPPVSQQDIGRTMGTTYCGTRPDRVALGVNFYTHTRDAVYEIASPSRQGQFMSRQITSISTRVPVIAVIAGGSHTVILNGGRWRTLADGSYEWVSAYVNDPDPVSGGANHVYSANRWLRENCDPLRWCQQAISVSAMGGWESNLDALGQNVVVAGAGSWPPSEWPLPR